MRDLLPPKARLQSRVGSRIMRSFELFGYARVWLPTFEYAELLERTRTGVGSALRFVEPDSGEVVALRADMTPQIARVVSTRYRTAPSPARLCYQGSVLRRRRERARTESQVVQAGIELVGMGGIDADFEVVAVLCAAVRAAGLEHFVLDVGHAGIAAALLAPLPAVVRSEIREALATKDGVVLERRGRAAGLTGKHLQALVALADLQGGAELGRRTPQVLEGTPAEHCARELCELARQMNENGIASKVVIDFGEVNRFDYYTGPMFQVLAAGPGEPLASGGRYDDLYPRFGIERAAAGCALDLNNVCWALEHAGWVEPSFPKLVTDPGVGFELLSELRSRQIACAVTSEPLRDYAEAWAFDFVLERAKTLQVVSLEGDRLEVSAGDPPRQAEQIAEFIRKTRGHA